MSADGIKCDVAVVGGGPAGSTLGTFLAKYGPNLDVRIFEAEVFPRDHVGESQLPNISEFLHEMGVWEKVEAAGFPVKVGGTFKWGMKRDLWHFSFLQDELKEIPRPAEFAGQRRQTAFHVDRSVYDKILLDHAEEVGCKVYQGARIQKVLTDDDCVMGLRTASGEAITARYYVDATGHRGTIRTAFDVPCEYPTALQNVAFWGYWQNAEWPENIGIGGTRAQIMSLPYGWVWFFPISQTRTSVGLVLPASYYKESRQRPEELYQQALKQEPRINYLLTGAAYEGQLSTTKDWSFLASRIYGANWFLAGESAGFADPILSAGMTITQACARELAFTILELERGEHDPVWLLDEYQRLQSNRVRSHIKFADFWYTSNGQFEDLKEYTRQIAKWNGLDLSPNDAWTWLARGGFIDDDFAPGFGTFHIQGIRELSEYMDPVKAEHPFNHKNVFRLNLDGAQVVSRARYVGGRVVKIECYERDGKILPLIGAYEVIVDLLRQTTRMMEMVQSLKQLLSSLHPNMAQRLATEFPSYFWAMVESGWITASRDPAAPLIPINMQRQWWAMEWHKDKKEALRKIAKADGSTAGTI